jgi:hypothetical protein
MAAPLVFNSDADQRRLDAVVVVGAIGAVGFVFYLLGRFVSFVLQPLQQLTKHAYFCLLWIIESTALLLAGKNALRRSCSPNCSVETMQVFAHRCFPTGVNTPVSLHLQATVHRFCGAVNARLIMVKLNKTKPEDYMRPLDVPGDRGQFPHALHCSKNP